MKRCHNTGHIWLLVLMLLVTAGAVSQTSAQPTDPSAVATSLLEQQRWDDVVRLAEGSSYRAPQLDYCYGMALAKLQRWEEAARAFTAGSNKAPADKRFPIELAGIAFQRQRYGEAAAELKAALRLDPRDNYANDFLGTVYLLEENLAAALKYWNRIDKPALANVTIEPHPRTDPVLLDRAFALSPASVLRADDLQLTKRRLDLLQVFSSYRFELLARENGNFDLLFRQSERNGWGDTRLQGLLRTFRNLPFQTINPEFFNLGRSAANFVSVVRWDSKKQRVYASFSAPLRRDPKWRYELYTDLRKERWNLADVTAAAADGRDLRLRKAEAGANIESIASARWGWRVGFSLSQRSFDGTGLDAALVNEVLRNGFQLKYSAQLKVTLLSIPERRLTTAAIGAVESGRLWGTRASPFTKTTAGVKASWFPLAQGDDYRTSAQLRLGKTFGQVPFDELFMLGIERDNDLWMHAHVGTRGGMKGSAPMGRDYVLLNWELDKDIRQNALFHVSIGPLLDTGRFLDNSAALGSRQWLCDLGIQAKLRLFGGVGIVFSYARDLRRGREALYVTGSL